MEFTRYLGHKYDMPGSGQWNMFTDFKKRKEVDFDEYKLGEMSESQ